MPYARKKDSFIPANNLKKIIASKNISLNQLSELSGVPDWRIKDYSCGRCYINKAGAETVCKLAKALNCSFRDILEPF